MKPPSTDTPPPLPPVNLPPRGPRPKPTPVLSRVEIVLLVAIVIVGGLKIALEIEPESWAAAIDWAWRAGTAEAIQPGIDVITGVRREPPR